MVTQLRNEITHHAYYVKLLCEVLQISPLLKLANERANDYTTKKHGSRFRQTFHCWINPRQPCYGHKVYGSLD
ncbi:hypothetical protein GCM10007047_03700 [Cerasicoccus arenae]|uniref:Uncharacterized protein n=1 Tax=Cerasicoccus arenae TaxID=424488 RepID=A0A8J3DEW4_9BACT|nr:hypothetical protein GCM10007047_03700 [Cerasicoccus arenae]